MDTFGGIVQNADMNASPNSYLQNAMLVREIFYTLQGEMPYAGRPAIFLRLGGCNLGEKTTDACFGCDTSFEINKSTLYSYESLFLTLTQMHDEHQGYQRNKKHMPLLVITGGEPLLQRNQLYEFFMQFGNDILEMFDVQFETNGMFEPHNLAWMNELARDNNAIITFVVSPKGKPRKRVEWYTHAAQRLDNIHIYIRRVVVADPESIYHNMIDYANERILGAIEAVYVSPQTVYSIDPSSKKVVVNEMLTDQNKHYAVSLCLEHGYLLSLQTHVDLGIE